MTEKLLTGTLNLNTNKTNQANKPAGVGFAIGMNYSFQIVCTYWGQQLSFILVLSSQATAITCLFKWGLQRHYCPVKSIYVWSYWDVYLRYPTGPRFKVSTEKLEKPGLEPKAPGLQTSGYNRGFHYGNLPMQYTVIF